METKGTAKRAGIRLRTPDGAGDQGRHDDPVRDPTRRLVEVATAVMRQRLVVGRRMRVAVRMAMHCLEFSLKRVLDRCRVDRPMRAYLADAGHDQPLRDQQQQDQVTEAMVQAIEHRADQHQSGKPGVRRYRAVSPWGIGTTAPGSLTSPPGG